MTMRTRQVTLGPTDGAGAFSVTITAPGRVMAVGLVIGTLETPDITITDALTGAAIFAKTGIAASARWAPRVLEQDSAGVDIAAAAGPPVINNVYGPPSIFRTVTLAVAGGGATKTGTAYLLLEA
jgi:hypothetical protein